MIAFLVNIAGLLLPGFWLGRKLHLNFALLVAAAFLIFKSSLVMGASLLSWAGLLGQLHLYQIATTLCSFAIAVAIWWIARGKIPVDKHKPAQTGTMTFDVTSLGTKLFYLIPILGLVVFGALLLLLTLNAYPSVEDSLTIKLPKIVFAIQGNTILPTNFTDDGRMYISPMYPALVQLFLIINGQKGHALLVFGFVNWVVCGIAIYRICQYVGATNLSSLIVTALVMLTPTLLVQGSSEGDDLIAATPFVLGLMFLVPALEERHPAYAVLAGIGIGLSLAMKLMPVFYSPALVVLFCLLSLSRGGRKWLRERISTIMWISAAVVFAFLPHAIVNWIAFDKAFHVAEIPALRNWQFSTDCALRASVGHLKQLALADIVRLTARVLSVVRYSSNFEIFLSKVFSFNEFFSGMIPYNPIPACTDTGAPFELTKPYVNENTLWFGVIGVLLLVSCFVVVISSRVPPVVRALALGYLLWQLAFDFIPRYYGENFYYQSGRYWPMAVLAGCPTIAVLLDLLLQRRWEMRLVVFGLGIAGAVTVLLGVEVLTWNNHRSYPESLRTSRYSNMLTPEFARVIAKAKAVNVQALYGINTYDYYMRLGSQVELFNKATLMDDAVNIVAVRPFGIIDNPYADPRIPVRMSRPFAGGFQFVGANPAEMDLYLTFANNFELVENISVDSQSSYLIFQGKQLMSNGEAISGVIFQIASSRTVAMVRYRVGWRAADGTLAMSPEWRRGAYMDFRVPERAATLVIEAAFDGDAGTSLSEWPMRGFLTGSGPKIVRMLNNKQQ